MNTKFKRYKLTDSVRSKGKMYRAYMRMPNGEIRRKFERTTKKWRKENLPTPIVHTDMPLNASAKDSFDTKEN